MWCEGEEIFEASVCLSHDACQEQDFNINCRPYNYNLYYQVCVCNNCMVYRSFSAPSPPSKALYSRVGLYIWAAPRTTMYPLELPLLRRT